MGPVMNAPDLARLIADRKGDRSYDQLSRDGGGKPTPERLQQLATGPIKNFPGPDTIQALARSLDLTVGTVLAAAARTLGLDVRDEDPTVLALAGAGTLPSAAQDALRLVARELLSLHRSADHGEDGEGDAERPAPSTRAGESPAPIPLRPLSVVDETLPASEEAAAALEDPTIREEIEAQHEEP